MLEHDASEVTGGGGIAEHDGSAVTGGGGMLEYDGRAINGGGGIAEHDGSAVTGGGGIAEHDASEVTGGGGITDPPSAVIFFENERSGLSAPGPTCFRALGNTSPSSSPESSATHASDSIHLMVRPIVRFRNPRFLVRPEAPSGPLRLPGIGV
jgi:hypothetical protein